MRGYEELRHRAALLDLSGRGLFWVSGRDRVRFLHNLTTNHVKNLQPGQGCYAFLLTPQGRIVADLTLLCLADRFLLDVEPEARERAPQHLRRYIIADQVALEESGWSALGVEGPEAQDALTAIGAPAPAGNYAHEPWGEHVVARVSLTGQPGFRIYTGACEDTLRRLGLPMADHEAAAAVRIENRTPRYGDDILETSLPQETRQMHAVHFQKGCYLGQEIVERIRARGHVNKLLAAVEFEGTAAKGEKLRVEGAEAGEVTSVAYSPAAGKLLGLAYVRAAHAEPGTVLTADGGTARVL